ncbi:MAG TPA: hypothetical protein VFV93_12360 [Thermomicrobiales bacterium]|nr:hypothetical protein [Thermomicrobiales bacterium]
MCHTTIKSHPWAVTSVVAAIAAAAAAGTVAEVTRRALRQIAALDPRASFDPYYGMVEDALNSDPR